MNYCRHCERFIEQDADGTWIDPEADGDDVIWRETCDRHDTFTAQHDPEGESEPDFEAIMQNKHDRQEPDFNARWPK